ncbi:hypothetical protein ACFYE9_16470 [Rhizobium leguminosarum]|uniref:Uncharacterized protein n=1 Tax=Rhizobium leguminosarum TaxID=384 RepID=A0ACD5F9L7_RHILE|nr:hypothetical protein [Rhizobium leguminosarum]
MRLSMSKLPMGTEANQMPVREYRRRGLRNKVQFHTAVSQAYLHRWLQIGLQGFGFSTVLLSILVSLAIPHTSSAETTASKSLGLGCTGSTPVARTTFLILFEYACIESACILCIKASYRLTKEFPA